MENARELMVAIFEELTRESAPQHPIFASNDKVDAKDLNEYELMQSNGSSEILLIKTLFKQKQDAITAYQSPASIAQISFYIREANGRLNDIIYQIEQYAQQNENDRRGILNFANSLKQAYYTLRDLDLSSATQAQVKLQQKQQKVVQSAVFQAKDDKIQQLDELLQGFESIAAAKQRYQELDKQIDNKVDVGIEKLKVIKQQVQGHREIQAVMDEKVEDVQKNVEQAQVEVKGLVRSTNDLRKKLMSGDKLLTIVVLVMIVLIIIYWIYRLCVA